MKDIEDIPESRNDLEIVLADHIVDTILEHAIVK